MTFADEASGTPALDPTVVVLLSIFGGALLTAVAGALGAFYQNRREHARWLRERRYEAYVQVLTLMDDVENLARQGQAAAAEGETGAERLKDLIRQVRGVSARLEGESVASRLLGPDDVTQALHIYLKSIKPEIYGRDATKAAEASVRAEMQRALGIRSEPTAAQGKAPPK